MQVEPPNFTSSSPLSSLVPSSDPSIEPAPPVGARVKVTYSRKPAAQQEADSTRPGQESSSSSSQPASPSDHLFDTPVRSYGRNTAAADTAEDQDANDVTITTAAGHSPSTTAHAANSAIKPITSSSLFRRVDSQPSQHSDNDDEREQSSADSPAVNRPNKFQFGIARAIYDSDSDSEVPATGNNSLPARLASKQTGNTSKDKRDDDAIIARIRAQRLDNTDSDPFGGSSLSSLNMSSPQAQSSLQKSDDEEMPIDDAEGSLAISRPRGAKISAMRGKGGQAKRSKFSSSSDKEASAASDDEDEGVNRKARAFKLASSPSSSSAPQADDHDAEAGPSTVASRREKIAALAARARKAHGGAQPEANTGADPLIDAFLGGGSPERIPSRSPSLDIQDSDEAEHNDAMPAFMASKSKQSKPKKNKSKKSKGVAVERDVLSDLEDDFDRANAKVASKRTALSKEKAPPKVKPLSKKELETMNRQTARIARENRARLSSASQRKTIGLNDLLNKIQASEGRGKASNSADSATVEQPSSQIPSGQSKSQHASDPIESDPIPERSSPHPTYSSSPVVPVSRQQERRLGLDQFNSSANILPAGRVPGVATKPDDAAQMHQLLAGAGDDDDDAHLPDLASIFNKGRDQQETDSEAKRKLQQLRDMKLRLLEKSRQQQQPQPGLERAIKTVIAEEKNMQSNVSQAAGEEDEDLEVYKPGEVLAQKHNLPTTPGRKRPTDMVYRELGIKPGKTPPGRKPYTGTDAKGSPNTASLAHKADDAKNEDIDELMVSDSQLRSAGKGLFVAADQAAGNIPATQPQHASTQARQDESHAPPPATQSLARAGPLKMTQAQLNATLMRKMQTQSLKARSQKDIKPTKEAVNKHGRAAAPDVKAMLAGLSASATAGGQAQDGEQEADEDEDDPDFIMPLARDAESVIGSDVDMGSASEAEAVDDADDLIDMGSADEDEENQDIDEQGVRDTIEDAEEVHDSEKENAPPPASQQSQLSNASPSLGRALPPSRAVMDDDEDELPVPRATARRGRRSALADDEDGDDEGEENSLQPGPFDRSRDNTNSEDAVQSQSPNRARVPLGDISSQSIDQSIPFSRSNTSSPAVQHAQPPDPTAIRRDPILFPLTGGQEEDDSFRTDDIPSQAGDLGRFFEPTMPPPAAPRSLLSQAPQKSFWDQTQTQTQSQTQDQSQLPPSTRPAQTAGGARGLERGESANSALGAFFQDTQQDELRGESLDIFDNPKNADGKARGYTQFYFDGTLAPSADAPTTGSSVWDASAMPPPKSTEVDAFAALRKAQMGEAMDLLDATPSVLPSFDESQAEREAYAQAEGGKLAANMSPEKMYMNRDGFFTQTKPSQQAGLWSQYDSQSQSQSQNRGGGVLQGGPWPSPAADAWRGSELSIASHVQGADEGEEDEEEDAPVQLKRLRRGVAFAASPQAEEQNDGEDSGIDENGAPSSQPEPKPRNAFDVLREGPIHASPFEEVSKDKKRKSAFIEGEAEESEDEELGGDKKRGDGGGLKGIIGDDNDNNSAADEDEDDEDDANAEDLQELVENEREVDEAEKDELVNARYREDVEARERADLELHTKAAQGGLRNRRGRAGLNGIEGFLDDDADEEELQRRAALGQRVGSGAWKKRKLDGTEDGMEKLAEHEEAKAFVRSYEGTHRVDHESDKYGFLALPEGERDDDDSDDEDEDEGDEGEKDEDMRGGEDEGVEEDEFGPVVTAQRKTIRFDEVRAAVRERKKAKNRRALDNDEDDDKAQDKGWDSDEDDTEARLAVALKDRTKLPTTQPSAAPLEVSKRKKGVVQYGKRTRPSNSDDMDIDRDSLPHPSTTTEVEIEDEDHSTSLMARLLSRPTLPHPSSSSLRHSSSMAVDTLEDAEPEWGNDANLVRAPKPSANAGTSQNSTSSKASKFGASPFNAKTAAAAGSEGKKKAGKASVGSMLLGKQGIMRRESGFSASSSGSGSGR
ncbi:uncharacterized protein UDID_03296 [Ustilago sp. UG-2017a]|nr:uncharacterized protein UDID_03296 [Ustilago sp. UG-2017a]